METAACWDGKLHAPSLLSSFPLRLMGFCRFLLTTILSALPIPQAIRSAAANRLAPGVSVSRIQKKYAAYSQPSPNRENRSQALRCSGLWHQSEIAESQS